MTLNKIAWSFSKKNYLSLEEFNKEVTEYQIIIHKTDQDWKPNEVVFDFPEIQIQYMAWVNGSDDLLENERLIEEDEDVLKKVNNIDDVAKELVRNKKVYRAVNESSYNFEKLKTEGLIDGSPTQYPTYVSLDKYDDANLIKSKLQLPKKPTWVAEFDGNQILNDVKIPNGKYLKSDYKEVLCRSHPNLGEGGGSQFITNSPIKISRLVNLETGEVINFK